MATIPHQRMTLSEAVERYVPSHMKVVLPPALYDRAEAQGYDMAWYVKSEPLPLKAD